MNVLQAIVLGVVEGVTEYLPVSSTGHLILAAAALGLGAQDGAAGNAREIHEALQRFEVIIQGGAILAVTAVYWPRVRSMLRGAGSLAIPAMRGDAAREGLHLLTLLVAGFLPAAIVGLLANKWIKAQLFFPLPVIGALAVGGAVMILLSRWHRRQLVAAGHSHADASRSFKTSRFDPIRFDPIRSLTWQRAMLIGCFQVLALWPGTSRSMVTMLGGMVIGLPPVAAAEFAFLLGLPTLSAASAKELLDGIRESGAQQFMAALGGPLPALAGLATATITAAISVKWLVSYLGRHTLELFGWWRIMVAGAFAWAIVMGWIARG